MSQEPGVLDEAAVNARANEKARKRKAARDRMLATKTIEKGLLIVHPARARANRLRPSGWPPAPSATASRSAWSSS